MYTRLYTYTLLRRRLGLRHGPSGLAHCRGSVRFFRRPLPNNNNNNHIVIIISITNNKCVYIYICIMYIYIYIYI